MKLGVMRLNQKNIYSQTETTTKDWYIWEKEK